MERVDVGHLVLLVMSMMADIVSTQLALLTAIPMQHLSVLVQTTVIVQPLLTLATQITQTTTLHIRCVNVVQMGQISQYVIQAEIAKM